MDSARAILPLLKPILADLVDRQGKHRKLKLELASASEQKAQWSERRRRFDLEHEAGAARLALSETLAEAHRLGVRVLSASSGIAAFPSIVNGALAMLVFRVEDDDIRCWRYQAQPKLRQIPSSWYGVGEPAKAI